MEQLKGMHHVTAITSSAEKNYEFFTYTLGMRLVKKTVNQDDIQTYHLFFADDQGNPGTDMTFFDFPGIPKGQHGTNEIARTSFRVPSDEALDYWVKRFNRLEVKHQGIQEQFGKKILPFVDFDDQQYQLISDENDNGVAPGTPWQDGPIPLEYAITGLGPIIVRVDDYEFFKKMMEQILKFKEIDKEDSFHLFETGEGGNGGQIIVEYNTVLPGINKVTEPFITPHFVFQTKKNWKTGLTISKKLDYRTLDSLNDFISVHYMLKSHHKFYLKLRQTDQDSWMTSHTKHLVKN